MESLLFEIEVIARPYSSYRGAAKWRTNRQHCLSQSNTISSDNFNILIFREDLKVLDYYPISSIVKRIEIKRSHSFFQYAHLLWQHLNPASLKSISKAVHLVLIETLYKQNPHSLGNPTLIAINSKIDNTIDFYNKLGLTFAEYYDILFECIDTLAKSGLVNEYCRIIQSAINSIHQSVKFCSINLYNKRHLNEVPRPSYYSWMQPLLRSLSPSTTAKTLPEIVKKIVQTKPTKPPSKTLDYPPAPKPFSLADIQKHSKSPIQSITPTLIKAKSTKHYEQFELKGLKASFTPVKSLFLD